MKRVLKSNIANIEVSVFTGLRENVKCNFKYRKYRKKMVQFLKLPSVRCSELLLSPAILRQAATSSVASKVNVCLSSESLSNDFLLSFFLIDKRTPPIDTRHCTPFEEHL